MKKILLSFISAFSFAVTTNAQLALETFDHGGALPTGWSMINDGHTVSTSFTGMTWLQDSLNNHAWFPVNAVGTSTDYQMITTSYFTTAATADRWLITPSFLVTSANMVIQWDDNDLSSTEHIQVLVSPTAGTTAASFTASMYSAAAAPSYPALTTHYVNIGSYNGTNITVAFRDNTTNNWGLLIDNVKTSILSAGDIALLTVVPAPGAASAYVSVGSNISFSGTVQNMSPSTFSSYDVAYSVDGGAPVTCTISSSLASTSIAGFTHTTPYTVATAGAHSVKIWAVETGDILHTNDTLTTTVYGVSFMPTKKIMFEEATGSWCGWCVRGIVYMDSLEKLHPGAVSEVAVHNGDPMVVSAWDTWVGGFISGYPSVVFDRQYVDDPSTIISYYNAHNGDFGFADITMIPTYDGTSITVATTINPAVDLTGGDYRIVLGLTEDSVHNASGTGTWLQHNYYSGGGSGAMNIGGAAGYNFATLPGTIPAATMYYNHVSRAIKPSATGTTGLIPGTMTVGTPYTYTFPAVTVVTAGGAGVAWTTAQMHAIVMLIDGTSGKVLNSQNAWVIPPVGVSNVVAGVENLSLYPNPASNTVNVVMQTKSAKNVTLSIVDMSGKVVYNVPSQDLSSGVQTITIPTTNLVSGIYTVRIETPTGVVTERLTIAK